MRRHGIDSRTPHIPLAPTGLPEGLDHTDQVRLRSRAIRRRPRHARRRPPVSIRTSVLTGAIVGGLALTLWLFGVGNSDAAFATTATVRPGDTLTAIAVRYHTTVAALVAANGVTNPNRILAGSTLQIPGPPAAPAVVAPVPPPSPVIAVNTTVVVRPGDTLSSIATRNHTTVAALVSANKITNPNLVFAGAHLVVPGPGLPPGWGPGGPLPTGLLAHADRLALRPEFVSAATNSGVPANLIEALCWWESGWQSNVTSSTGAIGLCQLEPSTVLYAQTVLLHNPNLNPRSAADNIAMAAAYLHDLTVRDGGTIRTAVAAYYQGLISVQQKGMLPSTQNYVTGIFNYAALFAAAG